MTARILVVDDVPANTRLLEAKLGAEYYQVTSAHSGLDALRLAQVWQPDLILLDVMMPEMDVSPDKSYRFNTNCIPGIFAPRFGSREVDFHARLRLDKARERREELISRARVAPIGVAEGEV